MASANDVSELLGSQSLLDECGVEDGGNRKSNYGDDCCWFHILLMRFAERLSQKYLV